jgi:hypothetical protein
MPFYEELSELSCQGNHKNHQTFCHKSHEGHFQGARFLHLFLPHHPASEFQLHHIRHQDSYQEVKKYVKQQVKLLARWENIDSFLIEECQRLEKMFIKAPSLYSIKNCAPSK